MNTDIGFDLSFSREYFKPALIISLLSVWVLVGLFYYLNRYTKRRYFTTWTVAWMFYALWLTLSLSVPIASEGPLMLMLKQWCISTSAVFLLWGSVRFLNQRVRQRLIGMFMAFLFVWSYIGAFYLEERLWVQMPIFALIGLASIVTSYCFFSFRVRQRYIGAGLLGCGFLLWGSYLIGYPLLQTSEYLVSSGFFISAVLQLFIAVSMIILVLEEARTRNELALEQVRSHKVETEILNSKILSTEERYRSLFDQASEGIIITSTDDLKILELNQTARRFLGITRLDGSIQSLPGFCDINADEPAPKAGPGWFAFIRVNRQINLIRRDGGATPTEVDGAVIKFEGRPAYQFFFREITERARLEQQLRQAEKLSALGQMISGVAHELNNPLAVIKGYMELVLARHELAAHTRNDLEKVARECNRAAKLVSNFLSFAREQPAQKEMVDLNELLQRVTELRRFDLRVVGIELTLQLAPDLPMTLADADQIQQVALNLVNNAAQAMVETKPPHKLLISSQARDGVIEIAIQDNGPGVPDEIAGRIFEPFFTTKDVGTGTGLGLSIAHSILADHEGRIYYEHAPGGGARFVLEFPVRQAPTPRPGVIMDAHPVAAEKSVSPTPHARILILDDEKSIAELLSEMLGILGYQPTMCHSAPHALELIDEKEFDVILSDFRMPIMDGQEFYKRMVAKKPALAKRIVFLTGDVVNEDTQDFLRSTGNPHIAKPFQLDNVEKAVARILTDAERNAPKAPASPAEVTA